jgi:hypothetical protein
VRHGWEEGESRGGRRGRGDERSDVGFGMTWYIRTWICTTSLSAGKVRIGRL